jgi:GC-rich sequence DNA-binding factor
MRQTEEPFKPRKSTLSQAASLQKLATHNAATAQSSAEPTTTSERKASTYNNDYLAQLRASTPTRATLAREPDIIVPYDDDDSTGLEEGVSAIPDEAAITSAITRRRRLAADPSVQPGLGTEADYVSLNADTSRLAVYDSSAQPHPESRLQRESDSEGEGDESLAQFTGSNERIRLGGKDPNAEAAKRVRREMRDAMDDDDVVEVGDEDEVRWEEEQVRRAGVGVEEVVTQPKGYTSAKSTFLCNL